MHRRFTNHPMTSALLGDAPPEVRDRLPRFRVDPAEARAATLFLGPRAEQGDLLRELVAKAVDDIVGYRHSYLPDDPVGVTPAVRDSPAYDVAMSRLRSRYDDLLEKLKLHSTPYFSMRYQGHMLHDTLLPGILGYFATMLHNPNNVTVQASTLTTFLELIVGWDLCTMVGFPFKPVEPWGHITADGSVANLEALWSARELRLFCVAAQAAVRDAVLQVSSSTLTGSEADRALTSELAKHATGFEVRNTIRGTQGLLDAPTWDLCNVAMADALSLPDTMATIMGVPDAQRPSVWNRIFSFGPNTLGLFTFYKRYMRDVPNPPVLVTPATKHYSWPKASSVLGMGDGPQQNVDIAVGVDARVSIDDLRLRLDKLVAMRQPVALTVAVMGTTEEGACDALGEVLEVREEFRRKGLEFNVHADAAWGGYFVTTIRRDFADPGEGCDDPFLRDQSHVHLNAHTRRNLERIREADSVTIDPHKMGFIQYPAGALCYRDNRIRNMVTYGAYVIGTPGSQVSVGEFGIEGSKPGAAPAAVYLAHSVLRPSSGGYGQLINEVLRSTKAFYLRIATLAGANDPFICVPLARLPSERDHAGEQGQWIRSIERLRGLPIEEILADADLLKMFNEIGPDQNIVDYTFNLRLADGTINRDLAVCRALNDKVYQRFHVHEGRVDKGGHHIDYGDDIEKYPLLISQTQMNPGDYGDPFIDDYANRLGIELPEPADADRTIFVNRTVVMDPWLGIVTDGGELFLDRTMEILRKEVSRAAHELRGGL